MYFNQTSASNPPRKPLLSWWPVALIWLIQSSALTFLDASSRRLWCWSMLVEILSSLGFQNTVSLWFVSQPPTILHPSQVFPSSINDTILYAVCNDQSLGVTADFSALCKNISNPLGSSLPVKQVLNPITSPSSVLSCPNSLLPGFSASGFVPYR